MKANYWKSVLVGFILFAIIGIGRAASSNSGDNGIVSNGGGNSYYGSSLGSILMLAGVIIVAGLIITIVVTLADIFLLNPLEAGCRRFFMKNLEKRAEIRELTFGFDHSYGNVVKTLFFRDLFQVLWTLLFIVPGFYKYYEYRMIPYLLAEYPDMPREDAFSISRYMMDGNKWKAFVLDLSFIPWLLLTAITGGIVGVFYVFPYMAQTEAALYDALKMEKQPFSSQTDDLGDFVKGGQA